MKIRFKRSVRVLNGNEESWNVIDVRDKPQFDETELMALERVIKFVYDAHERHSQSKHTPKGDLYFNVSTQKEER